MLRPDKAARVLLVLAGLAGGLALLLNEIDRRERAVREQVWQLARKIRAHDGSEWMAIEGVHPPGHIPRADPVHEQLLHDLDRLAHLEGLVLTPTHVDVDGDRATANCRVESREHQEPDPAAPRGGQFKFWCDAGGWRLTGNRFVEAAEGGQAASSGSAPSAASPESGPHRHPTPPLVPWLAAACALALLAALLVWIRPKAVEALHRRRDGVAARSDS